MFYRICRLLNIVSSSLIILIIPLGISGAKNSPDATTIFALLSIFAIVSSFLLFDFFCGKFYKHNGEQISISRQLKKKGRIIFIFNLLFAIAILAISFAMLSPFLNAAKQQAGQYGAIYISINILFIVSGVSAIVNLFFFNALLKKNKIITATFINTIGNYS